MTTQQNEAITKFNDETKVMMSQHELKIEDIIKQANDRFNQIDQKMTSTLGQSNQMIALMQAVHDQHRESLQELHNKLKADIDDQQSKLLLIHCLSWETAAAEQLAQWLLL